MKNKLGILLLLALASCAKTGIAPDEQEITIYVDGVQSGDFTKADSKAVSELIESLLPTSGVTFQLTSTTASDRTYTVAMGETITLPVDSYKVTAYYRPTSVGNTVKNGYIYQVPRFYVDDTIVVCKEQQYYAVDAIYECWALVIDYDVCSKYQHLGYSYSMEDFTYFATSGSIGIAFIYGSYTNTAYVVKSYPKDEENYEPRQYSFVSDRNYTGTLVEYGKWYALSPSSIEGTDGGISTNYSGWAEGSL